MEDVAVVVAVPGVHAEVLHRLGALLGEQLHVDVAHGGVEGGLGPDSIEEKISSHFSIHNSSQNYTYDIWVRKKFGHVSDSKCNLKLFFKPKLNFLNPNLN